MFDGLYYRVRRRSANKEQGDKNRIVSHNNYIFIDNYIILQTMLVYCYYASPVWAAIPLYLDELIESVQRKALKIIFGRVDYTEALVLAGLESLSDRRVGACKRFMATARQMSPLKNIIPSPAAIESHYSIRVQLPRRQHGHTRRINDFVTYKYQ